VPDKVAQLFTAQLFHDRKQRWTRLGALAKGQSELDNLGAPIDYLRPIVADADTGHGGEAYRLEIGESADIRADGGDETYQDDGRIWSCWYSY
jgi:isocitrate lyase